MLKARLSLTQEFFPFLSTQVGPTVQVREQFDTYGNERDLREDPQNSTYSYPLPMYMHNVMPVNYGLKSITYSKKIKGISNTEFDKIFLLRASDESKVFFSPARGKNYILGAVNPTHWTGFPFPVLHNTDVTVAYVNGDTYICYKQQGVFRYDPVLNNFHQVNFVGIVGSSIHGICNANNYLIVWDHNTVYWSSAIDALDFTPSLSTTSGSGKIQAARGAVVCCLPIHDGFVVYTTANAIAASFSGNVRFPWTFREIPGSAGVTNTEHVTYDTNYDAHFAWTTSGMLRVDKQRATPIWPALTDFLTSKIYEHAINYQDKPYNLTKIWSSESQYFEKQLPIEKFVKQYVLDQVFDIKLAFLGARYIVISYKPKTAEQYLYALVYDLALARWGKLRIPHVDVFTWVQPNYKYNNIQPMESFGFLQRDGTIYVVDFSQQAKYSDSLLLFGRLKLARNGMTSLNHFYFEGVMQDNFAVRVLTSTFGQEYAFNNEPFLAIKSRNSRKYNLRVTGNDHIIVLAGTFDLSGLEIDYTLQRGR